MKCFMAFLKKMDCIVLIFAAVMGVAAIVFALLTRWRGKYLVEEFSLLDSRTRQAITFALIAVLSAGTFFYFVILEVRSEIRLRRAMKRKDSHRYRNLVTNAFVHESNKLKENRKNKKEAILSLFDIEFFEEIGIYQNIVD